MNKSGVRLTLSNAIVGYFIEAEAGRLSDNTLSEYRLVFRRFLDYIGGDTPIGEITVADIAQFQAHIATATFGQPGCAPRDRARLPARRSVRGAVSGRRFAGRDPDRVVLRLSLPVLPDPDAAPVGHRGGVGRRRAHRLA